jgi:metallophosphoesterase (TIGR03767 family)
MRSIAKAPRAILSESINRNSVLPGLALPVGISSAGSGVVFGVVPLASVRPPSLRSATSGEEFTAHTVLAGTARTCFGYAVRTTLDVTIHRKSEPIGRRVFSTLVEGPGEPHQWRDDLGISRASGVPGQVPFEGSNDRLAGAEALLRLVHLTDTHVIDASSPARAEYVELAAPTDARWDIMVPMFRPHELLQQHALAAMVDTINTIDVAPVSGEPLDVVIVTGDCVDNAQRNELKAYLALLDGGSVCLPYDGVQSVAACAESTSHDSGFWCPDPSVDDYWKRAYGFPSYPGLLEAIDLPLVSKGLQLPWLGVVGNHDWLRQGTAKTSNALEAIAVGAEKMTGMPPGFLPEDALVAYLEEPASYNVGATTRAVRADPDRVGITTDEFIRAHIESDDRSPCGAVRGHGFGVDVNSLRPDYVADFGAVRIIAMDTNHPAGHYQGSLGLAQLAWLEERLVEAKNVYVLLASHHPTEALTNQTQAEGFANDRVLADPVAEVLHRHSCVIGWLTGHRHHHRIKAHRDPLGVNPGFWEITTSSIIDWPSQARILEVLQLADGEIVLASTVLDHHGTIDPGPQAAESLLGLAGAHREIAAANAVQRGESFLRRAPGRPGDRNVILPVR